MTTSPSERDTLYLIERAQGVGYDELVDVVAPDGALRPAPARGGGRARRCAGPSRHPGASTDTPPPSGRAGSVRADRASDAGPPGAGPRSGVNGAGTA